MNIESQYDQIETIIGTANELLIDGSTDGSTSEQIAGAFVLNRMDYLPCGYTDVSEAWERLNTWQEYVKIIKRDFMNLVDTE